MSTETLDEVMETLDRKMDSAIESLKKDFIGVRTGRATPAIFDPIKVDYYGTPTPLAQVGTISTPEPQLLVINPWDKNMIKEIEREIQRANLGLSLSQDGNIIRAVLPPLTEERRKELVKSTKKMGEETKIAIRNVRREANESTKKLQKDKHISQDEEKAAHDIIQKKTDAHIETVNDLTGKKETELMTV
ncbi:MAG: ribosome recycling factor [SAR324 cluster bacterium]|nr:ribosome recycling factor [SAR324 cluster bacterium]